MDFFSVYPFAAGMDNCLTARTGHLAVLAWERWQHEARILHESIKSLSNADKKTQVGSAARLVLTRAQKARNFNWRRSRDDDGEDDNDARFQQDTITAGSHLVIDR